MSETGWELGQGQPVSHFGGFFAKIANKRSLKIICKFRPELSQWRKGWDLNPRYGLTVHRISNPAHSTTLPPFLLLDLYCQMPARADFKVLGTNLQLAVTMQAG